MSIDDAFWAIIAESYTVSEYTEMIDRCLSWIRIVEPEWA